MEECPYCLNPILETEEVTTCRVCGTAYHAECLEENDGCALKDCEKRVRAEPIEIAVDAQPRTMLLLSREAVEKAPEVRARKQPNPCFKCGIELPLGEIYCPDCAPISEDSINPKSLWPMLAIVAVIALLVTWMAVSLLTPDEDTMARPASREVDR